MIRLLIRCLRMLPNALERGYLEWARRDMGPLHPDLPEVVHRLRQLEGQ